MDPLVLCAINDLLYVRMGVIFIDLNVSGFLHILNVHFYCFDRFSVRHICSFQRTRSQSQIVFILTKSYGKKQLNVKRKYCNLKTSELSFDS